MLRPCSVCERVTDSGLLKCDHVYCKNCFDRYVHGSVEELMHSLRCTICGRMTVLTSESMSEVVEKRFGRMDPRFYKPTGITRIANGSYAAVDLQARRIYIIKQAGKLECEFPYVHNYIPMHGIAVTKADEIIVPCSNGSEKMLAYFTPDGGFLGCAYLPHNALVHGLAVSSQNEVYVGDTVGGCVHIVHELKRLLRSIPVPSALGDRKSPKPHGVTINSRGNVIVTDTANNSVKIMTTDGELLHHFGSEGQRPGQFMEPMGVCVDSRGRILVADSGNKRIQLFDYEGNFLHFIVRYIHGEDVYMSPVDVLALPNNTAAVLLRGEREVSAAEIRIYSCAQVKNNEIEELDN